MGVGILKYHLYDIDGIISRTLAHTLVTELLMGVYAGLGLLATEVFRFHSAVAVAASTLAVAALFHSRADGSARCRPPFQPGQIRRGGDGGDVRGAAEGRG
jgi:hypothetical protein